MSEIKTPRCDAFEVGPDGVRYVLHPRRGMPDWVAFARQLERELQEAQRENAQLRRLIERGTPISEYERRQSERAGEAEKRAESAESRLQEAQEKMEGMRKALEELLEAETAIYPAFEEGAKAQEAWAERKLTAERAACAALGTAKALPR